MWFRVFDVLEGPYCHDANWARTLEEWFVAVVFNIPKIVNFTMVNENIFSVDNHLYSSFSSLIVGILFPCLKTPCQTLTNHAKVLRLLLLASTRPTQGTKVCEASHPSLLSLPLFSIISESSLH